MKIISHIFRPLPRALYLEPVFGCNYRCFFCLHGSLPAVKPVMLAPVVFERLKPILDKVSHVHLTGMGEPFLNPHLKEYLAYFREKGIKYYINSNGSLIQDGHMQLLLTSQSELSISLDAADKQTYQSIRHPENWDKVIGKIQRISQLRKSCASRSPLLYLSYHINQLNLASLKNLPDLCRELGIDAVKLSWTILPETKKELSPFKDLAGAARLIRSVATTLRRQGVAIRDEVLFQPHERGCWDLTEFAFIGANGQVAACCNRWLTIGDLLANGFEDIWNGQPHRRICFGVLNHQPAATCESCRQLQAVDYRIDAGAFIKNHKADETLLFEKQRVAEKLPTVKGLDLKFAAGFDALNQNDIPRAVEIYAGLYHAYPDYYEIRNNLAAGYFYSGQPEKSKKMFADMESIPYNHPVVGYNRQFLQNHGT